MIIMSVIYLEVVTVAEQLAITVGYLQWLAFENVSVHRDQT